MSVKKVFAVFDAKAEAYLKPFYTDTRGLAVRAFQGAVSDPQHDFNKYSEDYTLFELGAYDESSGQHMNHKAPEMIVGALTLRSQMENQNGS